MIPFENKNHYTIPSVVILFICSIISGLALGIFAGVLYHSIFFCLGLLLFGPPTCYDKLLQLTRVKHTLITPLAGGVMAVCILTSLLAFPYLVLRDHVRKDAINSYQVEEQEATALLDKYLTEKAGVGGVPGYWLVMATTDEEQFGIFKIVFNSSPVFFFLYWIAIIFITVFPVTAKAIAKGKEPFNLSAGERYATEKVIGVTKKDQMQELLISLRTNCLLEAYSLLVDASELSHPRLALIALQTKSRKGDVLLRLLETYQEDGGKLQRRELGNWEISRDRYTAFLAEIPLK